MALSFSGTDRNRYAEPAAALCCAVLAAAGLWLLVRLLWSVVPRGDEAFSSAPVRAEAAAAGTLPAQSIARWHLFGNSPLRPGAGAGAPATTLSLILRGTLAENDPKAGIALIADPQNGERSIRVGEEVVPGARLSAVYSDRIVLEHEGAEEILKLPRDSNLAPADVVPLTPAKASSRTGPNASAAANLPVGFIPSAAVPASGANVKAPADWQQTVARLRQNPDELARRVQVVPVLDGGKLTGVRLSAGADAALISQIGLHAGDVITSVNGTPIDSFARGQEIMSKLSQASSVRVTVLRDGKTTEVTVGLQ
ncbi:MAG: type II secretion system protein N [Dokdonella sp.]